MSKCFLTARVESSVEVPGPVLSPILLPHIPAGKCFYLGGRVDSWQCITCVFTIPNVITGCRAQTSFGACAGGAPGFGLHWVAQTAVLLAMSPPVAASQSLNRLWGSAQEQA